MIPSNLVALLLAVMALSPGYAYIKYAARRRPRAEKTTLFELGEFLVWGAVTTGLAALLVLRLGELGFKYALELDAWVASGSSYLVDDPWRTAISALMAYSVAVALALGASWVLHHKEGTISDLPVWWNVLGERPKDHQVFCSVTTSSGRILEGFLFAHTTPGDAEPRDIALKGPLWLWLDRKRYRVTLVDRVVIPGHQIVEIAVRYELPEPNESNDN